MSKPQKEKTTDFDRFVEGAKKVLSVSKEEYKAKEKKWQENRRVPRKTSR